jgi:hypothetical protein
MGVAEVIEEAELVDDGWGDLPESHPIVPHQQYQIDSGKERRERIQNMEDGLLEKSLQTVAHALSFADIDPGATAAPEDWGHLTEAEKGKRLRVANAAWLGKKDAPVGLELSRSVAIGIIRARSVEKAAPRTLNVVQIQMSAPLPQFETVEVEEDRNG